MSGQAVVVVDALRFTSVAASTTLPSPPSLHLGSATLVLTLPWSDDPGVISFLSLSRRVKGKGPVSHRLSVPFIFRPGSGGRGAGGDCTRGGVLRWSCWSRYCSNGTPCVCLCTCSWNCQSRRRSNPTSRTSHSPSPPDGRRENVPVNTVVRRVDY